MYNQTVKNSTQQNKNKGQGTKPYKTFKFFFILIIILISNLLFTAYNLQSRIPLTYIEITVDKGDTLWSIASTYNQKNEDIRKVINQIKKINKINDPILYPGQTIKIPG